MTAASRAVDGPFHLITKEDWRLYHATKQVSEISVMRMAGNSTRTGMWLAMFSAQSTFTSILKNT